MKQIVPIVLTALMLTSLFAAIDFADELKDTNEMETDGRADYEIRLHDVLQPRETFVDQGGNTRNGIDIGDIVYFRPIIINDGDMAQDEFNIHVTVTPVGDNMQSVIDTVDDAVCPGDVAVTGCSFNDLPSGDFLGGGNYRVQAESGGDLSWSPTLPGEYTVSVAIVDASNDDDLTNNDMSYSVTVQHYHDIVVDLCWTDGPGGDCKADDAGTDAAQGEGPHNFALSVTAEGSEAWEARATTLALDFGGNYDAGQTGLDLNDGNGVTMGSSFTVVAGETMNVDVWHNVSNPEQTVTDTNDLADNPCSNGDNPCREDRTVLDYGTTYTYHGVIKGDPGSEGSASSVNSYSVTAIMQTFDSYEPDVAATGGGFGSGEDENAATIMVENTLDYDDRTGNNDGMLSGYFSVFHDVAVSSLTGGANEATEGTLNVGDQRIIASVVYGGMSEDTYYDWSVTFSVTDENGADALNGASPLANECLNNDDPEHDYSHTALGRTPGMALPFGTACIDVNLQPGRYTVTATVALEQGQNSNPTDATDMNSGNNVRGTFFEVINDNPTVFMTLDDIMRDGASVEAPVIVGDIVTMRARGTDTETDDGELLYSWSRVTANGESLPIDGCDMSICTAETDMSWIGERMVTATVTDGNGASASASMLMSVWNSYSVDMSVTGATMSYSIVYGPMIQYNVSATDGASYTQEQLGNNAGAFDSVVSFDMDVTNVFMPTDMGTETLTINFDGDATSPWGLWYKRTTDSPWTNVDNVATTAGSTGGTTMTYTHDGGLSGNLGGGTYAIFDVATAGAEPPATGVTGLTADLKPDSQVDLSWGYGDDSLLNVQTDTVNVYYCAGDGCDATAGTAMPAMQTTTTTWTLIGTDGESYTILVQTENGNTDVVSGATLSRGSASITVTADGSVSPAPTLSNAAATKTSTDDGLTFTWDATDTGDVSAWVICWAGTQDAISGNNFLGGGDSCAVTSDTTTSITVTEQAMCGGSCNAAMYFGIAGADAVGNVADPGVDMYADMKDGLDIPDVIDGGGAAGEDDAGIGNAVYAILALVVIAVIGGAYILTRGAEGDGDDKEWDY